MPRTGQPATAAALRDAQMRVQEAHEATEDAIRRLVRMGRTVPNSVVVETHEQIRANAFRLAAAADDVVKQTRILMTLQGRA
jgi:hypothetical protein